MNATTTTLVLTNTHAESIAEVVNALAAVNEGLWVNGRRVVRPTALDVRRQAHYAAMVSRWYVRARQS